MILIFWKKELQQFATNGNKTCGPSLITSIRQKTYHIRRIKTNIVRTSIVERKEDTGTMNACTTSLMKKLITRSLALS